MLNKDEREAYLMAKEFGMVLYQERDLPEWAPNYPVEAFVILRERTNPDTMASMMFGATGHKHYAWGGYWNTLEGRVPSWVPFIRDYREHFLTYFEYIEAIREARELQGIVALAYLNSRRIVAREYKPLARSLLNRMSSATQELLDRYTALQQNPRLIESQHHIKGVADAITMIDICHKKVTFMAFPKQMKADHQTLLSCCEAISAFSIYYGHSLNALLQGHIDESQQLVAIAGTHFRRAGELHRTVVETTCLGE